MEDFITFTDELLQTTTDAMEYSQQYLLARKESSSYYNALQVLLYRAGLHNSKKSIENKITELLAHEQYGEQAREINEKMELATATYKGLELVIKSYLAHASGLQSIIKQQTSGEMTEAIKNKYSQN